MNQKITPFLWFVKDAEKAAEFYASVFKNAKINHIQKYPEAAEQVSGQKAGSVMTADLTIEGMHFQFLNGGEIPGFDLKSSAVSFMVSCETQEEIDYYWKSLSFVPEREQCGWCQDKFGVTWQIVPTILGKLLSSGTPEQIERVTACFLKMKKFNIKELEKAYNV